MERDDYYLIAIIFLVYYFELYKPILHKLKMCEGYSSDVSKIQRTDTCPCGLKN